MSLQIDSDRQKGPPPTTNDGWVETTEVLRYSREKFLHQMFPYLEGSDAIFHGSAGGLFLEKKSPDHNRERAKELYLPASFDQHILCLVYLIPMTDSCDWYIFT